MNPPSSPPAPPPTASRRERNLRPTASTLVVVLIMVVVLRLSLVDGGRAALAVPLGAFALLVLDAVVAIVLTRRVRLSAFVHPTDLATGDRFAVHATVVGPALPVIVAMSSRPDSMKVVAEAPASGRLQATALGRGVVDNLTMVVSSDGLCGLLGCARTHKVPLPRPLVIGPRPVPAEPLPALGGRWGEGEVAAAATGDLVRAVRPYVPGDRLRQVHWRATAKAGELVVKETEETLGPLLHLVVDLGDGGPAGEAAAGRAAWYGHEARARGYRLLLTTNDDGRALTAPVTTDVEQNRRLARAVPGRAEVSAVPAGSRYVLVVSDEGDRWP